MKTKKTARINLLGMVLLPVLMAQAQITLPGINNFPDGDFNPTGATYVVNLANATTGVWTDTPATNGVGIYDPEKWAIVFKYASVNIPAGTRVRFINHPSRAPVVWLVNGNVTVAGTVDVSGLDAASDTVTLTEPGPGGFRGGAQGQQNLDYGSGLGPDGGYGHDGRYLGVYGNSQIVPLIGGTGGGGYSWNGGAGGGAILVAASGSVNISGNIYAYGGGTLSAPNGVSFASRGSGGAIRVIADQILGNGRLEASGANFGRIRLEGNTVSQALSLNPPTIGVPPNPVVLWPPTNAPTVRVVSIGDTPAPPDPRAEIGNNQGDITLTNTGVATIVLQTANFATNGTIDLRVRPRNGTPSQFFPRFMSGNSALATWQVTTNLPLGHFTIQARAITP